jgi:hypothetical protein
VRRQQGNFEQKRVGCANSAMCSEPIDSQQDRISAPHAPPSNDDRRARPLAQADAGRSAARALPPCRVGLQVNGLRNNTLMCLHRGKSKPEGSESTQSVEGGDAISTCADEIARKSTSVKERLWRGADQARWLHRLLGLPAVVLAATAGFTVLADWATWIPATCAFAATVLGGIETFLRPARDVAWREKAAAEFSRLSDKARDFAVLDVDLPPEKRREILRELREEYHELKARNASAFATLVEKDG